MHVETVRGPLFRWRAACRRLIAIILCVGASVASTAMAQTPTTPSGVTASDAALEQRLHKAKTLLAANRAADAFALLSEFEFDGAGNLDFDYTLGIAALDSGRPDRATLAFDRVLILNPNHAGALVDRGRAHAALGSKADARADFEAALRLNPSAAMRTRLDDFLRQLDGAHALGATYKAYVALTVGHDSNVNFAVSDREVFVPRLLTTIELAPESTRLSDAFMTFAGGAAIDYTVTPGFGWFASADATSKRNKDVHDFTTTTLDLRAGPMWTGQRDQVRLAFSGGRLQLADENYRKQAGLGLDWRHSVGDDKQFISNLLHTRYRYDDDAAKTFDTNQSVALLGFSYLINKDVQTGVLVYLLGGLEKDTGGNLQGDKRFYGMGLGGRVGLTAERSVSWSIGAQQARYTDIDPFFLAKRKDKRYDASLALNQRIAKRWLLRPQLLWTRQDSNFAPNDFDRVEASVVVRRDFR